MQAVPAVVAADGTWTAPGQLGDEVFGAEPGDGMRLVTVPGVLDASVR